MRGRRPWRLPRGARIAVWTIVNVEEWDIEKPMARQYLTTPQGVPVIPDVPNWAWHEYGMRVGIWRFLDALTRRKIPATTAINANVCRSYPDVAQAMLDAGWEFMGHGVKQGAMHLLPDQRAAIREAIALLRGLTGKAPKGWLGPGLTETWETLDVLAEEGIRYVSDWVNDDQPYEIQTSAGPLVSVPYTIELNDIPMMVIQHHASSEWLRRARDQFDRLYQGCPTGSSTSRPSTTTSAATRASGSPRARRSASGISRSADAGSAETLEEEGQAEDDDPGEEVRREGAERIGRVHGADPQPGAAGDRDRHAARHVAEQERLQRPGEPVAPGQGLTGEGPAHERDGGGGPHADAETDDAVPGIPETHRRMIPESGDTRPHALPSVPPTDGRRARRARAGNGRPAGRLLSPRPGRDRPHRALRR
jgi:hypothetical protein